MQNKISSLTEASLPMCYRGTFVIAYVLGGLGISSRQKITPQFVHAGRFLASELGGISCLISPRAHPRIYRILKIAYPRELHFEIQVRSTLKELAERAFLGKENPLEDSETHETSKFSEGFSIMVNIFCILLFIQENDQGFPASLSSSISSKSLTLASSTPRTGKSETT